MARLAKSKGKMLNSSILGFVKNARRNLCLSHFIAPENGKHVSYTI